MSNNVDFQKELEDLINRHSMESDSNMPDFILASYLMHCLITYNETVNQRERFRNPYPLES